MSNWAKTGLTLFAMWMLCLMAVPARAQSIADLARQTRAKKQQAAAAEKVYTNDSIPSAPSSSTPAPAATPTPAAPTAAAASAEETDGEAPEGAAAAEEPAAQEPTYAELEAEYRKKFAELKQALDTEERRLDVLQRELNLAQQQFYADPNVAMREQYSRQEITTRMEELETQRAAVEKAKQDIEALETELRQKNLPPGWAR
jgi:hypothetical protein